jgi:sugar lactone lactonase YvrE
LSKSIKSNKIKTIFFKLKIMKKNLIVGLIFLMLISSIPTAWASPDAEIMDFEADPYAFNAEVASTTLNYTLVDVTDGEVALEIYNSDGYLIRTIDVGTQSSGTHSVIWDGKDDGDDAVPEDLYTAKLIVSFGSEGAYTFDSKWGQLTPGDQQIIRPRGITVDSENNIYVIVQTKEAYQPHVYRIKKFDSNGNLITMWGSPGQFQLPNGIAIDSNDNVYVTDLEKHLVFKFDSNGNPITTWGGWGSIPGKFKIPFGIAVDQSDNVYVTDFLNYRVQKFDSNGSPILQWGSMGGGPGQFWGVTSDVIVDSDNNVYTASFSIGRIQKFTSTGVYQTRWDGYLGLQGLGIDLDNNIFTAEHLYNPYWNKGNRIKKINSTDGELITEFGCDPEGNCPGSGDGEFNKPFDVTVDLNGYVYATDYNNHRVQKFAPPLTTIEAETEILVISSADGIIAYIDQLYEMGEIDNKGIANSLKKKLEAALKGDVKTSSNIIGAVINEVEAQAGKHISDWAASILKGLLESLL